MAYEKCIIWTQKIKLLNKWYSVENTTVYAACGKYPCYLCI